jgi:hypothetical protein
MAMNLNFVIAPSANYKLLAFNAAPMPDNDAPDRRLAQWPSTYGTKNGFHEIQRIRSSH